MCAIPISTKITYYIHHNQKYATHTHTHTHMLSRQRARDVSFHVPDVRERRTIAKSTKSKMRGSGGRFVNSEGVPENDAPIREVPMPVSAPIAPSSEPPAQSFDDQVANTEVLIEIVQVPSADGNGISLYADAIGERAKSIIEHKTRNIPLHSYPSLEDWNSIVGEVHTDMISHGFKYDAVVSATANSKIIRYDSIGGAAGVSTPLMDRAWLSSVSDALEHGHRESNSELVQKAMEAHEKTDSGERCDPDADDGAEVMDTGNDEKLQKELEFITNHILEVDEGLDYNLGEAFKQPGALDSESGKKLAFDDAPPVYGLISDVEEPFGVRAQRNAGVRSFFEYTDGKVSDIHDNVMSAVKRRSMDSAPHDFMIQNKFARYGLTGDFGQATDFQRVFASMASEATEFRQPRNAYDLQTNGRETYMMGPPQAVPNVFQ